MQSKEGVRETEQNPAKRRSLRNEGQSLRSDRAPDTNLALKVLFKSR